MKCLNSLIALFFVFAGLNSQASVVPSSINFGSIACGSSSTQYATFFNSSNEVLRNVSVNVSGINFSVSAFCPFEMQPNSTCNISVTYWARQPGTDWGTVNISSFPYSGASIYLSGSCH